MEKLTFPYMQRFKNFYFSIHGELFRTCRIDQTLFQLLHYLRNAICIRGKTWQFCMLIIFDSTLLLVDAEEVSALVEFGSIIDEITSFAFLVLSIYLFDVDSLFQLKCFFIIAFEAPASAKTLAADLLMACPVKDVGFSSLRNNAILTVNFARTWTPMGCLV